MVDPNFSGINPENLLGTIKSLESGSKTLHESKNAYSSRFQKFGLDTGALTEIGKIASWVDDELPMLRRRQALAAAMEFEGVGPKPTMVQLREPIWTVQQARQEGANLAKEANGLADMDPAKAGPVFHRIAQELAAHKGDPDFDSSFYAKMDPNLVKHLPMAIVMSNAPTAEDDTKVFGAAFTAAVNADNPAPGFNKVLDLFHGDIPKDDPGAVFNRALMQGDDPDMWDVAWKHLKKAVTDLGDPKATWTVHAGLVAGVIGFQSHLSEKLWGEAEKFSQEAKAAYEKRINAMSPKERAQFRKETRAAAKARNAASREAERIYGKYGLGPMSRFMEASVGDSARWLIDTAPFIRGGSASAEAGWLGKVFKTGDRLPLVGTLLTIGGIAYDIKVNHSDADVAVTSNVASLGVGMAATWGTEALIVAAAGGPVGWAVGAGILVGAGLGYAAYYVLNTETGKKAIHAVTNAVKDVGKSIGGAAKTVGGWLGL
ncbi:MULTISPECIES: hypothetical protein [unclassified Streptomyces]|uniref:hypothetical protein n=1 Tax=unclassified Streptomyces TaxID=2593676 RepID=UPI0022534531|nr:MULTISPECIES: hypothetical protein [unclassified Streptomyces]MCX5293793.1 hypothetical protein [Streptomyces sp. NBC_00183]